MKVRPVQDPTARRDGHPPDPRGGSRRECLVGGDPPGSFGTHDWIISAADALAGTGHGWLDLNVAYFWSDYPDTVLQDNINHIYYPGLSTAAPGFVQAHYDEAVRALQSGDRASASKEAALMAHYYDDLWNPWHADYSNLLAQALYHSRYEEDVLGHEPADATLDQLTRVASASDHAIAAATTSRLDYRRWRGHTAGTRAIRPWVSMTRPKGC